MILKLLTLVCLCHHMRITPDRRVLKFVRRKYKIEIEMETGNDNSWTDESQNKSQNNNSELSDDDEDFTGFGNDDEDAEISVENIKPWKEILYDNLNNIVSSDIPTNPSKAKALAFDAFRIANERELRHQARQNLKEKYIKLKVSQTSNEAAASF